MTSETDEKLEARSTSLYVTDWKAYEECKRLLKLQDRSLSEEIMDFVLRRRDELKGNGSTESSGDSTRRFEELKATHFQLGQKTDKLRTVLQEKKVYDGYVKKFGEILGYDPGSSWSMDECVDVIVKFMTHGSDDVWKRAETRFLMSCRADGGIVHTFLDYLENARERRRVGRKLLELRTDPEELARLDTRERQEEEQRKKEAEMQRAREAEEVRKRREEDESEGALEEEEEEPEDDGLVIDFNIPPGKLTVENVEDDEGGEED